MNKTVSDYVHMHKQIEKHKADAEQINNPGQISNLKYLLQWNKQIYLNIFSDTDGGGYSSDRRQSVSSGSVPQIVTSTTNSNNNSSLYTLIFHGFHEDWMEKVGHHTVCKVNILLFDGHIIQNMETLDKKQMILEHNFRFEVTLRKCITVSRES